VAHFRYINTAIWDDDWFVELDALEQHLFIYFLTNSYSNIAGIYQIPLRKIAFESGMDQEKVKKILGRFDNDGKVFYEQGWLVMKNWQKHQMLNPNQTQAVVSTINALPDWLKLMLHEVNSPMYIPFESLLKPLVSLDKGLLSLSKRSYQKEMEKEIEMEKEMENNKTPNPFRGKAKREIEGSGGKAANRKTVGIDKKIINPAEDATWL
jgi:hypothetical protein